MTKQSKVAWAAGLVLFANLAFAGVSAAWADTEGPCQDKKIKCGSEELPLCSSRTDACTFCMIQLGGAICIPQ